MITFVSTGAANRTKQETLHYFLGLLGFFVVFLVVFAVAGTFMIKSSVFNGLVTSSSNAIITLIKINY